MNIHKPNLPNGTDQSYAIIFDLRDVIFSHHPENRGTKEQFRVIKKGFEILHTCFAQSTSYGKKRHQLFVLSNASAESHTVLLTHFPEIFSLFDGIVTSAVVGIKKPDMRIYHHLLNRYGLDPASCIFIDDKESNVTAAQDAGMIGIVCDDYERVTTELKKLGVF